MLVRRYIDVETIANFVQTPNREIGNIYIVFFMDMADMKMI